MIERILIIVKTYPNPSAGYQETVCTAGITASGKWVRLYPIPFRSLQREQQFRKYDWIEADIRPARGDTRPESHNVDRDSIRVVGHVDPHGGWRERWSLVQGGLSPSVEALVEDQKHNGRSLGMIKPLDVSFHVRRDPQPVWTEEELDKLHADGQQLLPELFETTNLRTLEKIPYNFFYRFRDGHPACRGHEMQILDWEIHALYRKHRSDSLDEVHQYMSKRYYDDFVMTKDLFLFLGTLRSHPTSWTIIGAFPQPNRLQMAFDLEG